MALAERGARVSVVTTIANNTFDCEQSLPAGVEVNSGSNREAHRALSMRILEQFFQASETVFRALNRVKWHPDVVVVTVPALPLAFSARVLAWLYRVPLIVDLRDAWPDLVSEIGGWEVGRLDRSMTYRMINLPVVIAVKLGSRLFLSVLRSADQIITTSAWLEDSLSERGLNPVTTIRNAPIRNADSPRCERASRDGPRRLRLLYAGTVGRAQGIHNLVQGITIASEAGCQVELTIVGDGAESASVARKLKDLKAEVHLEPRVSYKDISAYYDWCDLAVVHLRSWEPLKLTIPSKLIEIIDRRVPVLLVAAGEPRSIVEELDCGYVVPPDDPQALADQIRNIDIEDLAAFSFEAAGDWVARNCDPDRTAKEFASLVCSVAEESEGYSFVQLDRSKMSNCVRS